MTKLGNICNILNGYAFKSEKYVDSGIRVIRITNVQKGYIEDSEPKFYSFDYADELSRYILENGDLLMSLTGNVGRVGVLSEKFLPAALNQRVACLRLKDNEIFKPFLFHFLNSDYFEQMCINASKGIAQKNLSTEWLKDVYIPDYSAEQQEQIADTLDKVTHTIDTCNAILEKLDLLVKSRFIELFGDPVSNPHNWDKTPLGELAEIKIGPFGTLLHKEDYIQNAHALVNPSHIIDGKIAVDMKLTVSDDKYNELSAYHLNIDDVVMGRRGEMGRCAVVSKSGLLCGTGSMIIRSNGRLKADYIQKIISFPSFKTTIEESKFMIICPPIEVQEQYYSFVEQTDKSKLAVKQVLEKAQTLKKALMQEYFG